jgi:DNA-binding CsgD family transcriptional regulator
MCLDKGNKAIAEELNISPYTVKNHVQTILASYEVRTRVGAVIKALLRGDVSILEIGQSYGSNNSTGG